MDLQTIKKYQDSIASLREEYQKNGDSILSTQKDLVAAVNLYADALILLWDGKSKGSKSMLKFAKENDLYIHEVII